MNYECRMKQIVCKYEWAMKMLGYETEAWVHNERTNEITIIDMYIHVYFNLFMYSVNEMSMKGSDMH